MVINNDDKSNKPDIKDNLDQPAAEDGPFWI